MSVVQPLRPLSPDTASDGVSEADRQLGPQSGLPSAHLAELCGLASDGRAQVREGESVRDAETLVPLSDADVGRRCALAFIDGDPERPLILGLLWRPGSGDQRRTNMSHRHADEPKPVEQVIEADERLTLRCGHSSVQLDADGTLRIKGQTVTTQAYGSNRIQGGSVRIN